MATLQYLANKDCEIACTDAEMGSVDLSLCVIVPVPVPTCKAGSELVSQIMITCPPSSLKTTLVDGSSFVQTAPVVATIMGSTQKCLATHQPVCMTDKKDPMQGGQGSCIKNIPVVGVNSSSGATITDMVTFWIKDAGQDKVQGC